MKTDSVLSNYLSKIGRRGGSARSKARARDGKSIPVDEVSSLLSSYFKMIGRKGGRAKSKKKVEASRLNGKLGGRPKKRQSKTL